MEEWDELDWFAKMTYLDGLREEFEVQEQGSQYAPSTRAAGQLPQTEQAPPQVPQQRVVEANVVNWDEAVARLGK